MAALAAATLSLGSLAMTFGLAKDEVKSPVATTTPSSITSSTTPKAKTVKAPVNPPAKTATSTGTLTYNDLPEELYHICSCESKQGGSKPPKHYNADGSVMRGDVNPADIGACQVNLKYHGAAAEKKGLDLFNESDNYEYAIGLYSKEGSTPWNWSKSCWGKFAK